MVKTKDLLPINLQGDKNLEALCEAIDKVFLLENDLNKLLVYLIDNVNSSALPYLAWQFHVEGYELAQTDQEKRNLVKNAIELHRYKGTKWAVKKVLEALNLNGDVTEWFEYGGEPYKFKVYVDSTLNSEEIYTKLVDLIDSYKNERSWLDSIGVRRHLDSDVFLGLSAKTGKQYHIGLNFSTSLKDKQLSIGISQALAKKSKIGVNQLNLSIPNESLYNAYAQRVAKTYNIGVKNG